MHIFETLQAARTKIINSNRYAEVQATLITFIADPGSTCSCHEAPLSGVLKTWPLRVQKQICSGF
jgi:hypothetical protein